MGINLNIDFGEDLEVTRQEKKQKEFDEKLIRWDYVLEVKQKQEENMTLTERVKREYKRNPVGMAMALKDNILE